MSEITPDYICQTCPCERGSDECCMNNTILTDCKNQGFNCKLQRYQHNQAKNEEDSYRNITQAIWDAGYDCEVLDHGKIEVRDSNDLKILVTMEVI